MKNNFFAKALVAGFLLLSSIPVHADEPKTTVSQKAETTTAPAAKPPEVIPVAEIATRAMAVTELLNAISAKFASSPEIENINKSLPEISSNIDREALKTVSILQQQPSLAKIQEQQQIWQRIQLETTGWLNTLTEQATRLQDGLNRLAELQKTWSSTRAAAQGPLQTQRTAVLDLQSSVAQEVKRCETSLTLIKQSEQMAVKGIFVRDARPLWSPQQWADALTNLPGSVQRISETFVTELRQYGRDSSRGLPLHMALFIVLAFLFRAARQQVRTWKSAGEAVSPALDVFENPYAAALIAPLFIATAPFSQVPAMVRILYVLLAIVPIILLLRPVITPRLVPLLYMLGLLFAFEAVRETFDIMPLIEQAVFLLETIGGIGVTVWLLRILPLPGEEGAAIRLRILRPGVVLALFILLGGLSAELTGFMSLARLMTNGIISASDLALLLYASVRVLSGIAAVVLHVWPLRMLQMVKHYRNLLEKRIKRLFVWVAVAAFSARLLNALGLLNPTLSVVDAVLSAKLERGSISISLGDVLAFVLAVWVSYLISNFIRFVLREDVYPRTRIAPGSSFAISSLLNYIILALGFVVGIGLMGVNLTKMSVLAGALGVGIGFGLQSVVNNFVSGLILLFERPVQVGDTIEVGDLQGEIKHIGIRASTVRTWRGSDIIVPNAQFITEKVTNWTLSDQLRRIDLPAGVNYGAAPKQVIDLLEKVAAANPQVLRDPPPNALFMGYGDSTINFELRAWTDQFKNWQQIRSELAVAVYDAVYAAGMTFSFPQRDVHIIQDEKPEKKE